MHRIPKKVFCTEIFENTGLKPVKTYIIGRIVDFSSLYSTIQDTHCGEENKIYRKTCK